MLKEVVDIKRNFCERDSWLRRNLVVVILKEIHYIYTPKFREKFIFSLTNSPHWNTLQHKKYTVWVKNLESTDFFILKITNIYWFVKQVRPPRLIWPYQWCQNASDLRMPCGISPMEKKKTGSLTYWNRLLLIPEKCVTRLFAFNYFLEMLSLQHFYNNFITNHKWLVIICSNLNLTLRLLFCPHNNCNQ